MSAICNAGAFGVLAGGNMPPEALEREILATRRKTDRPFGVNLITIAPNFPRHLEQVLALKLPFVILAGGLPPRGALARVKEDPGPPQALCWTSSRTLLSSSLSSKGLSRKCSMPRSRRRRAVSWSL